MARGIGVDVDPALGPRVAELSVTVCRGTACQTLPVMLTETEGPAIEEKGIGGTVSARPGPPTGGKHGFAEMGELTTDPVKVAIELRGPAGEVVAQRTLQVTPKMIAANGPGCGEGGPQANVLVDPNGAAQALR